MGALIEVNECKRLISTITTLASSVEPPVRSDKVRFRYEKMIKPADREELRHTAAATVLENLPGVASVEIP